MQNCYEFGFIKKRVKVNLYARVLLAKAFFKTDIVIRNESLISPSGKHQDYR